MFSVRFTRSLLCLCFLVPAAPASAFMTDYPPFPAGQPAPYPTLQASPVISYEPGTFQDGQLRITLTDTTDATSPALEIWQAGRKIFDTASVYLDFERTAGSRVFYTDLTADGRKDILVLTYPGSNGLGAYIELADLLISQPDGTFRHESFEAYAAGPEDFVDVNGDGRYELLWVHFYEVSGHSYWVYRVAEITDQGLRLHDALIPGFPKIIWFTEKPNDQPTQKLTPAEREDLIRQSTAEWKGADQE